MTWEQPVTRNRVSRAGSFKCESRDCVRVFAVWPNILPDRSPILRRRARLAEVPIEPGHQLQGLARERDRQVLVRRMLRAAGIGMRHPDGRQAEHRPRRCRSAASRRYWAGSRAWCRSCGASEAAAHCTQGCSGSSRVRLEHLVARLGDLHHREAVAIEMAAQRRQDARRDRRRPRSAAAARPGARRHRVDRVLGIAGAHGQDLERAPADRPSRRASGRARPSSDRSPDRPGRLRPRSRRARGAPSPECAPAPIRECGSARSGRRWWRSRARAGSPGLDEEPAPVAGMVAALARIDREVDADSRRACRERWSAGRPRGAGRRSRSARRRRTARGARAHSSRRPGEPISSPISISHLALKPSRPRVASTAASAARLIVCWPLLSAMPRP